MLAVGEGEEAGFLAVEEFLDHDLGAGGAEAIGDQRVIDRGLGLGEAHRDGDAFAGGEPVGFDDDRRAFAPRVSFRRGGIGKRR